MIDGNSCLCGMMVPRNDEELIQLWRTGLTMTDIGERVGLSRERVRQRLKKHGISGHNPNRMPSPERIREAIAKEFSLQHVARLLGVSVQLLIRGIDHADMYDEVEAAFATRRDYWRHLGLQKTQDRLVHQIRAIAQEVGHTPTQSELMERDVYHAELARYFGTAAEAMVAAGLEPNVRGNPPKALPVGFARREQGA